MSGIAGIIRFDGAPVEPGQIEAIGAAIAHRGPDGIVHWTKGPVALGHCMLRTTPESLGEAQPLANEDASLVLVMDGRLDNRDELRHVLLGRGIALRDQTDAALVLGAYQLWGEDGPRHLLGDFAYAIWDDRKRCLFCARDHFGAKPFYYFVNGDYLAFASEEEAFFGLPGVTGSSNEDYIAYFLVPSFEALDFNRSWLKDILKLPPGTTMAVPALGRLSQRTYWQLEPAEELRLKSDAEYQEAFRAVFNEAVRCRMRVHRDPALMLSGGIDSASIAVAAREISREQPGRRLHTFSVIGNARARCEETHNILSTVQGHERESHLYSVDGLEGITDADLHEALWSRPHPVDNSIILPSVIYMAASRLGHRVMLDGIEGDLATYTPTYYQSSLMRAGLWRAALQEIELARHNNTYQKHLSRSQIAARSAWHAFAPIGVKALRQRVKRATDRFDTRLIDPDFAKSIRLADRLANAQSEALALGRQSEQAAHIHALTQPGVTRGLEGYDRIAARRGIESRHPWTDKRLIEFFMRLPMRLKARQGWTKFLVRTTFSKELDQKVCWHSGKSHLGWPLARRSMTGVPDAAHDLLAKSNGLLERYVNPVWLKGAAKGRDGENDLHINDLFNITTLALWLNRIERRS